MPRRESYGKPGRHDQAAEVRVTQAKRAELVAVLGDPLGRITGVIDEDFLRDEVDAAGVLEPLDVEARRRRGGTSSG